MGLVTEFKRFAMRGNVIDLAVGVVIGTAFGKIVSALVEGIIMPLAGALTRGVDLSELAFSMPGVIEPVEVRYGLLVQAALDFLIIAFAIFLAVRLINRLQAPPPVPAAAPEPPREVVLLAEIRDLLKK